MHALEKWGAEPTEPNRTAFNITNSTEKSQFDWMVTEPEGQEAGRRFALAMTSYATISSRPTAERDTTKLSKAYPWGELGRSTVVDVGGSRGTDSVYLARHFPKLSFVVQDLATMIDGADATLAPELRGRVTYMPYSFLTPQTVTADVYLIKYCFHNWPDSQCVRILQNQVPALRKGARLVVCDALVPPPGIMSPVDERNVRSVVIPVYSPRSRC